MKRDRTIEVLHPRIGATFALIPLTIGVTLLSQFSAGLLFTSMPALIVAILLCVAPTIIFYAGTILIWAPAVNWTRRRLIATICITVGLCAWIATGLALEFLALQTGLYAAFAFDLVGGAIAIYLLNRWWWSPPQERAQLAGSLCPRCGYDLRAQTECRCPECGLTFTLGEFTAMSRESAALAEPVDHQN